MFGRPGQEGGEVDDSHIVGIAGTGGFEGQDHVELTPGFVGMRDCRSHGVVEVGADDARADSALVGLVPVGAKSVGRVARSARAWGSWMLWMADSMRAGTLMAWVLSAGASLSIMSIPQILRVWVTLPRSGDLRLDLRAWGT